MDFIWLQTSYFNIEHLSTCWLLCLVRSFYRINLIMVYIFQIFSFFFLTINQLIIYCSIAILFVQMINMIFDSLLFVTDFLLCQMLHRRITDLWPMFAMQKTGQSYVPLVSFSAIPSFGIRVLCRLIWIDTVGYVFTDLVVLQYWYLSSYSLFYV